MLLRKRAHVWVPGMLEMSFASAQRGIATAPRKLLHSFCRPCTTSPIFWRRSTILPLYRAPSSTNRNFNLR